MHFHQHEEASGACLDLTPTEARALLPWPPAGPSVVVADLPTYAGAPGLVRMMFDADVEVDAPRRRRRSS